MQSVVTTAIRSLLMEEGRVCLPGLGTLLLVQQPALVSLIEGKATAPSARVSFNANLVVDDGRLLREVERRELEQFLEQTNHSLDAGRTVFLEGIGKLYRQPDGELRFSASGENFSKANFGLPAVPVRPIVRKEKAVEPTPAAVTRPVRKLKESKAGQRYGGYVWYGAAAAAVLLLVFLLFRLIGTMSSELDDGNARAAAPPRERVNVSPSPTPRRDPETVDAGALRPDAAPRINQAPAPATDRAEPASPARNVAVIAIGLFGRQRNVDKQTGRLAEAGYTPYTDREGRNTRVGVQVEYTEDAELQRVLREIRARYTPDAFVMRVNGEERQPR